MDLFSITVVTCDGDGEVWAYTLKMSGLSSFRCLYKCMSLSCFASYAFGGRDPTALKNSLGYMRRRMLPLSTVARMRS